MPRSTNQPSAFRPAVIHNPSRFLDRLVAARWDAHASSRAPRRKAFPNRALVNHLAKRLRLRLTLG